MLKLIRDEMRNHAPFTVAGALTGIALMLVVVLGRIRHEALEPLFEGCHAVHVLLSAVVTAAMFRRYRRAPLRGFLIAYAGSIGIGTLSDIVFPYFGGLLLGAHMHFHLPFIEEWWLINPAAFLGIAIGTAWPRTRIPHSGHVLVSTWASLFYLVVYANVAWSMWQLPMVFLVLFVAVWLPCCVSDIAWPLLFIGKDAYPQAQERAADR